MKRMLALLLAAALCLGLAACAAQGENNSAETDTSAGNQKAEPTTEKTEPSASEKDPAENANILIAYFSVPEDVGTDGVDAVAGASIVVKDGEKLGNIQYVAQIIQQTIGGDLFRIETAEEYPLDHDPLVDQAADEQDTNARPELAAHVENFDQYDYVLLGFPNWWGDMPMAVYSFLEEYDFGSKTIIPFITHGGSGASRTVSTISELQPDALMGDEPLVLSRNDVENSEETVIAWAESLGLSTAEGESGSTVATAVPTPGAK